MTHHTRWMLLLAPVLTGCMGESSLQQGAKKNEATVCSAGTSCCKPEELVCHGDPDQQTVCTCHKSWSCDDYLRPEKCSQSPADVPDGAGGWSCAVSGSSEVCARQGSNVPPGKNGWQCTATEGQVVCTRATNTPDGSAAWDCAYSGEFKVCKKSGGGQDSGPPPIADGGLPPPPPPKLDGGVPPVHDSGAPQPDSFVPPPGWTCYPGSNGETICKKAGAGLPPGGSGGPGGSGTFKCYWTSGMITCEGSSSTPPGGNGWNCVKHDDVGGWRCKKSVGPGDTPGGGGWSCTSGTDKGGILCVKAPPPATPGAECLPGTKKWCDGHTYCGWGQVVCGNDGKWKRKFNFSTFKLELDCYELGDGRRPNTVCACYFFYYNKDCCETPDCIVPPGTNGQVCPASPGWYCDYCNPQKPGCKEGGAKCVTTSKYESFCGKDCAGGKPCPPNSKCKAFKKGSQTLWQCVPGDESCYY